MNETGNKTQITIALAKGRLAKFSAALLEACGLDVSELLEDSRKLVFFDRQSNVRYILVKPTDVPVYVDHGIADIGIVGKDTLMEAERPLYELLDLGCGGCDICVAGYPDAQPSAAAAGVIRVATKYPRIASMYYEARGENIEIIKLNGSIELAPILGLSDVIVDIVESGRTLRENGLEVLATICHVSARLVVNRVSLKTKSAVISPLIARVKEALAKESS